MPPTISRETAKVLADTIEKVKQVDKLDRAIQPRYKDFFEGLQAGIDDSSEEEIKLYRPKLAQVGDEIDECLDTVSQARKLLEQLQADQDLMETKFEQIKKLVTTVAHTRKRLSEQATKARELDRGVDKALAAIRKDDIGAEADLGALQAQAKKLMAAMATLNTEAPKLDKDARKAWDKKDQKALTAARLSLIDLLKLDTKPIEIRVRVDKYTKQYPDLDRQRKTEVQWLLQDLDNADDIIANANRILKDLIALGQVPKEEPKGAPPVKFGNADVQKIVQAFGLPADNADLRAKAAKILSACPVDQWPRELAKLYKAKESDLKAKLPAVRKLPAVKPMTLIDI
ncbi:MAG: hypothetical protein KF788_16430 [Piscinibacter sp.]|nr:hypothetical protein [Piscinibacter sp.]